MGIKQPYFGLRGTKVTIAIAAVAGFDMLYVFLRSYLDAD